MKSGDFKIRSLTVNENGYVYSTYQVSGYLHGERIRRKFKTRAEAVGEKTRLEIKAANSEGLIAAVNTRLTSAQVAEAEAAFARLNGKSMSLAVEWFLSNYRPPTIEKPLGEAIFAFVIEHAKGVVARHNGETRRQLERLQRHLGFSVPVHEIKTEELDDYMTAQEWSPKTWNNVRSIFHAFFSFCSHDTRRWAIHNPAAALREHEISRGLPEIVSAATVRDLFAFLETYTGGERRPQKPGFLVPFFALATFAGMRPSARDGEIIKLADHPNLKRLLSVELGVIQILPEISKTGDLRQIKIRPNLAAWLTKYPVEKYPLKVPSHQDHIAIVHAKFSLPHDGLRHTFISAHVGKWKSMGEAALEAGNSESIIKKHYLNTVSEKEADSFWSIMPLSHNK